MKCILNTYFNYYTTLLQAGSNRGATQSGMTIGGVRHVADIRSDDLSKESASHIGLQMGSNKGATQSGMTMGGVRHVADIKADDLSKDGAGVIGLQMGTNKGATQSGMTMGRPIIITIYLKLLLYYYIFIISARQHICRARYMLSPVPAVSLSVCPSHRWTVDQSKMVKLASCNIHHK